MRIEWWKMVVENLVRQSRLGYSPSVQYYSTRLAFFLFPRPHASFDPNFCFWLVLNFLLTDPISEDGFMTKWDTVVGDTFISNTSLKLLIVYMHVFPPLVQLRSSFMTDELPTDPAMRFTDLFLNREL